MRTIREVMNINISNMELSVRSTNGLKRMSINNLSDLTAKSQEDLRKIRNMGKKSIDEITEKIESIGLSFNMTDYD